MSRIITSQYPLILEAIPSSWESTTVRQAMRDIQPGFASGVHNQEGLGIPHLRPMNVDREGKLDLSVVKYVSPDNPLRIKAGDVLFNNTNSAELIGKTAYIGIDGDLAFSNHMTRLRPAQGIDHRFVAYQLHFLWMTGYFMHRCTHHVNQASISSKTLGETVPLVVPPSLEQVRIVEEIEKQFTRLDAAVGSLKRVQANLKRYRAAVLKTACEGRLVPTEAELARRENRSYELAPVLLKRILAERRASWEASQLSNFKISGKAPKDANWKEKYRIPCAPAFGHGLTVPEGWAVGSLEQLTSAVRVICYGILMPKEDIPNGVPYVRVLDLRGDRIDIENLKRTSPVIAQAYARASLKGGDILLAIRGSYGRVAEVPFELEGGNITQDTARLEISRFVDHRYIANCLRSPVAQNYFKRVARGVAVKGVNIADVRLCPIPVPPYAEQSRIAVEVEGRLSIIDELATQTDVDLKRAARLRQSILKDAFEGKLVPQNPSDEAASILLNQIASSGLLTAASGPREKGDVPSMPRNKGNKRITIVEALRHKQSGMPPEGLLAASGHGADSIDEFYAELKLQVESGLVEEIRSGDEIAVRISRK